MFPRRHQVPFCVALAAVGTAIIFALFPQVLDPPPAAAQEPTGFEILAEQYAQPGGKISLYSFETPDGRLYVASTGDGLAMVHVRPIVPPGTDQKEESK